MTAEEFDTLVRDFALSGNYGHHYAEHMVEVVLDLMGYSVIVPWEPIDGDIVHGRREKDIAWYVRRDGEWREFRPGTGKCHNRRYSDDQIRDFIREDQLIQVVFP